MDAHEPDDLVPVRPIGRPVRKMVGAFDDTSSGHRCRECPRYSVGQRWCPVRACFRAPDARVCRYGLVLLNAAALAERRAGHE